MSILPSFLGVYPETIERADAAVEKAFKQNGIDDYEADDMYDGLKYVLGDDFTNKVINELFLHAKSLLEKKGVENVSYYVNGDDSHFYIGGEEIYG